MSLAVNIESYLNYLGLSRESFPWFITYFVVVSPLVEEYYWRGWIGSESRGLELNDLLFAGYHIIVLAGAVVAGWLALVFVILSASAWCWRQLNRLNRGLLASTASHFAADISIMVAAYFLLASLR